MEVILFSSTAYSAGYIPQELYNLYVSLDEYLADRQMEQIDAGVLAWREADIIMSYIKMYNNTKDIKWIEKSCSLIEIALKNLKENESLKGWTTKKYSAALIETSIGEKNTGKAKISPIRERILDLNQASKITGHSYQMIFENNKRYNVYDVNTNEIVASDTCYDIGEKIINESLSDGYHKWIHQQAKSDNNYYSVNTNNSPVRDPEYVTFRKNGVLVPYGKDGETGWTFRKEGSLNIYIPLHEKPKDSVYTIDYTVAANIKGIPGSYLQIIGKPLKGDDFFIKTIAQEELFHILSEGMILYPILKFIAIVFDDETLAKDYRDMAIEWLELIQSEIMLKWNNYWCNTGHGGYYVFPNNPAYREPGEILPYNQFLIFGRCLLVLYQLTGKEEYLYKTVKISNYFKSKLILINEIDAYVWDYWAKIERHEDISHANLDIGFIIDAYEAGIVFTHEDLRKFANTFLKLMWNGSLENPEIGTYINSSEIIEGGRNCRVQEWVRLAKIDKRIYIICNYLIEKARKGDENLTMHLIANLIELWEGENK
jgi:hypothetical protein